MIKSITVSLKKNMVETQTRTLDDVTQVGGTALTAAMIETGD